MILVRHRPFRLTPYFDLLANPAQAGWWSAISLSFGLSIVILARAALVDNLRPLHLFGAATISLLSIALCITLRFSLTRAFEVHRVKEMQIATRCALSIMCLALLAAITLAGTGVIASVVAWSLVVAAESSAWTAYFTRSRSQSNRPPTDELETDRTAVATFSSAQIEDSPIEQLGDEPLPRNMTQRLTRTMLEDGSESLVGSLRVHFSTGERLRPVHLTFCPPFSNVPEINVEPDDGTEVDLAVTQVETYGARIEVKLESPAAIEMSIVVNFEAIG